MQKGTSVLLIVILHIVPFINRYLKVILLNKRINNNVVERRPLLAPQKAFQKEQNELSKLYKKEA